MSFLKMALVIKNSSLKLLYPRSHRYPLRVPTRPISFRLLRMTIEFRIFVPPRPAAAALAIRLNEFGLPGAPPKTSGDNKSVFEM